MTMRGAFNDGVSNGLERNLPLMEFRPLTLHKDTGGTGDWVMGDLGGGTEERERWGWGG